MESNKGWGAGCALNLQCHGRQVRPVYNLAIVLWKLARRREAAELWLSRRFRGRWDPGAPPEAQTKICERLLQEVRAPETQKALASPFPHALPEAVARNPLHASLGASSFATLPSRHMLYRSLSSPFLSLVQALAERERLASSGSCVSISAYVAPLGVSKRNRSGFPCGEAAAWRTISMIQLVRLDIKIFRLYMKTMSTESHVSSS